MMMLIRCNGAQHAYDTCRSFGLGRFAALYRAVRYLLTGRTGRYVIFWRPPE